MLVNDVLKFFLLNRRGKSLDKLQNILINYLLLVHSPLIIEIRSTKDVQISKTFGKKVSNLDLKGFFPKKMG